MPTLALDPAVDTTAPGFSRRRVWTAPAVRSHALVALTLTKLHLAPAAQAVSPQLAQRIQTGGDIEAALGDYATTIDLVNVTRVRFDLVENALAIDYRPRTESAAGNARRVTLAFGDHQSADEVYTKVWRRLGDRIELKSVRRGGWDAARFPVFVMAGILFLTTVLGILGNAAADGGVAGPVGRLFASYDWRVACGLGGGALAVLQMWLYRRLTQPPKVLELGPKATV